MNFRVFLFGLAIAGSLAAGEPETEVSSVADLKERIVDLENGGKLGFRNFHLCQRISGYGQYEVIPDRKVAAGSRFEFYYEPENLFTKRTDGSYQKWFTQDMRLRDANGEVILDKKDALEFNYTTKAPVLDVFGKNSLSLGRLPPGLYEFEAILHDRLSGQDASFRVKFEVVPAP